MTWPNKKTATKTKTKTMIPSLLWILTLPDQTDGGWPNFTILEYLEYLEYLELGQFRNFCDVSNLRWKVCYSLVQPSFPPPPLPSSQQSKPAAAIPPYPSKNIGKAVWAIKFAQNIFKTSSFASINNLGAWMVSFIFCSVFSFCRKATSPPTDINVYSGV